MPRLQKSRTWAERASKGFSFALTNMKRKSQDSSEPVTFSLNFRQAANTDMMSLHNQRSPDIAASFTPFARPMWFSLHMPLDIGWAYDVDLTSSFKGAVLDPLGFPTSAEVHSAHAGPQQGSSSPRATAR